MQFTVFCIKQHGPGVEERRGGEGYATFDGINKANGFWAIFKGRFGKCNVG